MNAVTVTGRDMQSDTNSNPLITLRPYRRDDLPSLLALNNNHSRELGMLSAEALAALVDLSIQTIVAGDGLGFVVTLDYRAAYNSINFGWFLARFKRFAYIDRVVVAEDARNSAIGRRFYDDVIEMARSRGYPRLCCEVNLDPPNPTSDRFHAKLGFREIGQAVVPALGKTLRYLVLEI